jgi:glycosyltransferase involved in cell wall biosynthesis
MRALVIYMYYLRPGDSGIKRFNEFGRYWTEEHGLQVTVLTASVHHHSGRIYPDMRGLKLKEEQDGQVQVLRAGHWPVYHKGFTGRAISQIHWAHNTTRMLRQMEPKPDLILASSPPLFVAWPMIDAVHRWRIPAIFEVRDVWPESILQAGLASERHPVVRYLAGLERRACMAADHIVTLVPNVVLNLTSRGLARPDQVSCIPNGVVLEDFDNLDSRLRDQVRRDLGVQDGEALAMYIGQHGKLQNVGVLLEVAAALRDRADIKIVSVGDGPERAALAQQAADRGLGNLRFYGSVSATQVPAMLAAADVGLSLINTLPGSGWDAETRGVFRNCLFDIAGARLPIVFNMPGFARQELQQRAQAGLYADTNHGPAEFAACIRRLADDPALRHELGMNNYREIAVRYNRRKMAGEYVELMRRVVTGSLTSQASSVVDS